MLNASPNPLNSRHIPQLDGLRAFAILPVLVAHSWYDYRALPLETLGRLGWAGVDLFFVLSGFLITGILLDAKGSGRYFRNFYIRRGLRIWPLYYGLLLFMFVLRPPIGGWDEAARAHFPWSLYALYLQNFFFATTGPMTLAVTWSLAVEEQFYLAWPMLVAWLRRETLMKVLIAIMVAEPVIRYFFLGMDGNSTSTLFRMDELCYGAFVACWMRSPRYEPRAFRRAAWMAAAMLPVALAGLHYADRLGSLVWPGAANAPLALGFAGCLGLALTAREGSLGLRLLNLPLLRYTGKISYGLYLYHPIVFVLIFPSVERVPLHGWMMQHAPALLGQALSLALKYTLVFGLAAVSWRWMEEPILRLKSRFATDRKTPAQAERGRGTPPQPSAPIRDDEEALALAKA